MKVIFIQIAADKADTAEQRDALQALRDSVAAYEAADAGFAERINVSKAKRGEAPTRVSPAKQKQLAEFERDRMALDEDMVRQFRALPSAQAILRALHLGISNQLPINRKQLKFFHLGDLAIGTAMLNNLETMAAGMADFLQRFPGSTEAEGLE